MNPEIEFREFAARNGYLIPDPIADGEIHRFSHEERNGKKSGFYVLHGGDYPAGVVGDWKTDARLKWTLHRQEEFTPEQRKEYAKRQKEQQEKLKKERKRRHADAKKTAAEIWKAAKPAPADHPYLIKKQVKPHGLRVTKDGRLVAPVRQADGTLTSLQFIAADGEKRFLTGGEVKGGCFSLPGDNIFCIAEGFATAATIAELTEETVIIAFNAGNLKPITEQVREKHKDAQIVICADNDQFTKGNPGLTKCEEAATAVNARLAYPRFKDTSTKPTDFNDLSTLEGRYEVGRQLMRACPLLTVGHTGTEILNTEFPEMKWVVPGVFPEGCTVFAGKPKMGKSLIALDIGLAVSYGGCALGSIAVEQGAAIYLALEDNNKRLKKRMRAVMESGMDRPDRIQFYTQWPNMDHGGLEKLRRKIERTPDCRLVIIDTLKKFRPQSGGRQNLYNIDYEPVSAITELAGDLEIAIVIVHHVSKQVSGDVMDTISGSFGLTGAADGVAVLERSTGNVSATLHTTGRDIDPKEYALNFDPFRLVFTMMGDASEVQATIQQQRLYDTLKEYATEDNPIGPKEIKELSDLKYQYVRKELIRLQRDGIIYKVDRGKYVFCGNNGNNGNNDNNGNNGNNGESLFPGEQRGNKEREQFKSHDNKGLNEFVPNVAKVPDEEQDGGDHWESDWI